MTPQERADKLVQDFRDAKQVGLDLRPAIAAAIQEAVEEERTAQHSQPPLRPATARH